MPKEFTIDVTLTAVDTIEAESKEEALDEALRTPYSGSDVTGIRVIDDETGEELERCL